MAWPAYRDGEHGKEHRALACGSGAPGNSQRAHLPPPWFCSEGGCNFLGESGGVTNLLSLIFPSTPQGGESCLGETEISFSLPLVSWKKGEGGRQAVLLLISISPQDPVQRCSQGLWDPPPGVVLRLASRGRQASVLSSSCPAWEQGWWLRKSGLNWYCFMQGVFLAAPKIYPVPRGLK